MIFQVVRLFLVIAACAPTIAETLPFAINFSISDRGTKRLEPSFVEPSFPLAIQAWHSYETIKLTLFQIVVYGAPPRRKSTTFRYLAQF